MKYTILFYLLLCISCGIESSGPESNLNQSGNGSGYFKCVGPTKCRLTKSDIAKDPGIHARWTIKYSLPCDAGNQFDSTMSFDLKDSRSAPIMYGVKNKSIIVEGTGPLKVIDHKPQMTRSEFFNNSCDLTFSYQATPSSYQIKKVWNPLVKEYIGILKHNTAIYRVYGSVKDWHATYLQNPESNLAILEQLITDLRSSGSQIDKIKANALQAIIDDRPADIYLPFSSAKARLNTYLKKSKTLKLTLVRWRTALSQAFTTAINQAEKSL